MRETGSIAREDAVGKIGQYRRGVFLCEANRERRERERRAQLQAKMQEAEEFRSDLVYSDDVQR